MAKAKLMSSHLDYLYTDCLQKGRFYRGEVSVTSSGKSCQYWMSQSPHSHDYNDPATFPDSTLTEAANFCRTPDQGDSVPWCYTTDPDSRWETCDIPSCGTICFCLNTGEHHVIMGELSKMMHFVHNFTSWLLPLICYILCTFTSWYIGSQMG